MIKFVVKILSFISPNFLVNFAINKLTKPNLYHLYDNERAILSKARKNVKSFQSFDITHYEWGEGDQKILLIHGWEGHAGNFALLIEALLENGFHVYAFDGPSHGKSSKGQTNIFEFSNLVASLIKEYQFKTVVTHSFGGIAFTHAMMNNPNLSIEKFIAYTLPDRFEERIAFISDMYGIPSKIVERLKVEITKQFDVVVEDQDVSKYILKANIKRIDIFHDQEDRILPIEIAYRFKNLPLNINIHEIIGTGHFKILNTPSVVEKVIALIS